MTDTPTDTARALLAVARAELLADAALTDAAKDGQSQQDALGAYWVARSAFGQAATPAAVAALCERLLALEELLGVLQWEGGIVGGNCIRCGRHIRAGHAPDCELAALLAAGRGGGDGDAVGHSV